MIRKSNIGLNLSAEPAASSPGMARRLSKSNVGSSGSSNASPLVARRVSNVWNPLQSPMARRVSNGGAAVTAEQQSPTQGRRMSKVGMGEPLKGSPSPPTRRGTKDFSAGFGLGVPKALVSGSYRPASALRVPPTGAAAQAPEVADSFLIVGYHVNNSPGGRTHHAGASTFNLAFDATAIIPGVSALAGLDTNPVNPNPPIPNTNGYFYETRLDLAKDLYSKTLSQSSSGRKSVKLLEALVRDYHQLFDVRTNQKASAAASGKPNSAGKFQIDVSL
jgi:hypothetical protein